MFFLWLSLVHLLDAQVTADHSVPPPFVICKCIVLPKGWVSMCLEEQRLLWTKLNKAITAGGEVRTKSGLSFAETKERSIFLRDEVGYCRLSVFVNWLCQ